MATASFETPVPASSHPSNAFDAPIVTPPDTLPLDNAHAASTISNLGTGAKIGIGIGVAVIVLLIMFLIFGIPYLRQRRHVRGLRRAVEEVEHGIEMQKTAGQSNEDINESKENMVLESRVEIVVGDDESERDVVGNWDGWNATWEEEDDLERGRKGMSLPRRDY
jgi:H+/gluconate symporter-like permease